jgi:hypothetical protein
MKNFLTVILVGFAPGFTVAQNVGIGITTPYSRLHVNGTAWFQGDNTPLPGASGAGIGIGFGAGASGGYLFAWNYTSFTARNLWLQHPGGSVIIGSTTSFPGGKLDVNGTGNRAIYATTSSGEAFYGSTSSGNAITGVSSSSLGMYAVSNAAANGGLLGEGGYIGIQGTNKGADANRQAVRGENSGNAGGYAALFVNGPTWVAGTLFKNAGAFLIDHPVEPESKFLVHSFVESPDMKNIYDGVVTTNTNGIAVVTMPSWFEALNMDFRYQLTCMGQFAQAIVLNEIRQNSFVIQTDKPNVKVSWQVTGTRNDPYAREHRLPVEKLKTGNEVGHYIYPQGYGKSADFSLNILKPTNLAGKVIPEPGNGISGSGGDKSNR